FTFSPDGNLLATGEKGAVRLWDARRSPEALVLRGHPRGEEGLAFSPDGRRLAGTSNYATTILVWDTATGKESLVIDAPVRTWDAARGKEVSVLNNQYHNVAFSPDGKRLTASIYGDAPLRIWDAATGKELLALGNRGFKVAFSPDGKRLAAAAGDLVRL